MQEFKINSDQLQSLLNVLGEFPAKNVINVIDMIRQLKPIEKHPDLQENK